VSAVEVVALGPNVGLEGTDELTTIHHAAPRPFGRWLFRSSLPVRGVQRAAQPDRRDLRSNYSYTLARSEYPEVGPLQPSCPPHGVGLRAFGNPGLIHLSGRLPGDGSRGFPGTRRKYPRSKCAHREAISRH
jgi:hypothetical protein